MRNPRVVLDISIYLHVGEMWLWLLQFQDLMLPTALEMVWTCAQGRLHW